MYAAPPLVLAAGVACVVFAFFLVVAADIVQLRIEDEARTEKMRLAEELAAEIRNRVWWDVDSWIVLFGSKLAHLGHNICVVFEYENQRLVYGFPPVGNAAFSFFAGVSSEPGLTVPALVEVYVW